MPVSGHSVVVLFEIRQSVVALEVRRRVARVRKTDEREARIRAQRRGRGRDLLGHGGHRVTRER